jgi:hypothetical protein
MMGSAHSPKPRPYWHVDAKWVAGLLLASVLSLTLLVSSLVQMTAEEPALETLSLTMALLFSRHGLDDETEIAELRQQLRDSPTGSFQPFPGSSITIQETDLVGRSPREIRLALFRQLAQGIYRQEAMGQPALTQPPDGQTIPIDELGILVVFTLESHRTLQSI